MENAWYRINELARAYDSQMLYYYNILYYIIIKYLGHIWYKINEKCILIATCIVLLIMLCIIIISYYSDTVYAISTVLGIRIYRT